MLLSTAKNSFFLNAYTVEILNKVLIVFIAEPVVTNNYDSIH